MPLVWYTRSMDVGTSLYTLLELIPDEEAAVAFFMKARWSDRISCPRCGSFDVRPEKNARPMPYRCKDCLKHFSVRTGTVMESSRLPLRKWLIAMHIMFSARKGMSSHQMARTIGVTQRDGFVVPHASSAGCYGASRGSSVRYC